MSRVTVEKSVSETTTQTGTPPALPPRPAAGGRGARRLTWIRYNWWRPLLHALLLGLAVINLYVFVWMFGTSLMSESEASRLSLNPIPGQKYRLADEFQAAAMLPVAMEPALADGPDPDGLNRLRIRLEMIHTLQSRAFGQNARNAVEGAMRNLDPTYVALGNEHSEITAAINAAHQQMDALNLRIEAYQETVAAGDAEESADDVDATPPPTPEQVEQAREAIDELGQEVAVVRAGLSDLQAQLERTDKARRERRRYLGTLVAGRVAALQRAGLLRADEGNLWPSETVFTGEAPTGIDPELTALARALGEHYSINHQQFTAISRQAEQAAADLEAMAGETNAPLVRVALPPAAGGDEPRVAYRLADHLRGRIHRDLYPRQILTVWEMERENIRRSESRSTFAKDARSPSDYNNSQGLADVERATAEIAELVDAGMLVGARLQPINYWIVLREENFLLRFMTSVVITAAVVSLTLLSSSMLGFGLAKLRFPGKMVILGVMIAAMVLPGEARTIPTFKMLQSVGALDGLWGLVIWLSSFGIGNALLMAGFFYSLPKEVDEAASVDGAGIFRQFFDIALPMARPIVITVGIFAFLAAWNDFLISLIYTVSRPSMQPLAVAVYNFQQGHHGKFHLINAAASIMIIPVILMFLIVQKHVVKSIAVGAVKG